MMPEAIQVMTTTDKEADAEKIAQALVEQRLAACVQILGPIRSTYRWQGKIESAHEWLCLVKTRRDLYPQVEQAIKAIHPYETPEILALPVIAGNPDYLQWLDDSTTPEP